MWTKTDVIISTNEFLHRIIMNFIKRLFRHCVAFTFILSIATSSLSQELTCKVIYFDSLKPEDETKLQALCFSLEEYLEAACSFRLQNFYEPEIEFDVKFEDKAFNQLHPRQDFKRKNNKMRLLTKPQFKFRGRPSKPLSCKIENQRNKLSEMYFEEYSLREIGGDVVVIWDQMTDETWNWGEMSAKTGQKDVYFEDRFFEKKALDKWARGYKKNRNFYKGKAPISKKFKTLIDEALQEGGGVEILIVYANRKVESEFNCPKIQAALSANPDNYKIEHDYSEELSTTVKPTNGKYKLVAMNYEPIFEVFSGYEIRIEPAGGALGTIEGKEFDLADFVLNQESNAGLLSLAGNRKQFNLELKVDWLGEQCLESIGTPIEDKDCDCKYDCLYERYFYFSIRGVGGKGCSLETPWSDKMKFSFQCEK